LDVDRVGVDSDITGGPVRIAPRAAPQIGHGVVRPLEGDLHRLNAVGVRNSRDLDGRRTAELQGVGALDHSRIARGGRVVDSREAVEVAIRDSYVDTSLRDRWGVHIFEPWSEGIGPDQGSCGGVYAVENARIIVSTDIKESIRYSWRGIDRSLGEIRKEHRPRCGIKTINGLVDVPHVDASICHGWGRKYYITCIIVPEERPCGLV